MEIQNHCLYLQGGISFHNALDVLQRIQHALSKRDIRQINLQAITHFDSAGVAVLLASLRYAKRYALNLRLVEPSDMVTEMIRLNDLTQLIPFGSMRG